MGRATSVFCGSSVEGDGGVRKCLGGPSFESIFGKMVVGVALWW